MPGSVAFMVVAIVLIVTVGKVISGGRRMHMMRHDAGADGVERAEALRLREDVRALKERIAVLERVVTDNHGSIGLDREIERLRDR